MATVEITGTIQDASGGGVENVPVQLVALPAYEGWAEIVGGVGVVVDRPVEVLTESDGTFAITAIQGVQYRLIIDAIALDLPFRAPDVASIGFHLLGLQPRITDAVPFTDEDGDTQVDLTIEVFPEDVVLERFDSLVIEKSTAGVGGPYSEVDTLDLVPGQRLYELRDAAGEAEHYYRAHYLHTTSGDEGEDSEPINGETFGTEALVLTVDEFKQTYLFGLDLTDENGQPYPPIIFERAIRYATQWLEKELDIAITARDITEEAHDHYAMDYSRWGWLKTHLRPVIRLDEVRFQYPSMTDAVVINDTWLVLEDEGATGVVQIVPGQGSIADVLLIPGQLMPLWSGATGRVPGVWRLDYRAGFEVDDIPEDLRHVIGMLASLPILNVAGDLVGGAGLQGWSVSIPGLNQSVTTTNSSTNAGFGARLLEYLKEIKFLLPGLKDYYGARSKLAVV